MIMEKILVKMEKVKKIEKILTILEKIIETIPSMAGTELLLIYDSTGARHEREAYRLCHYVMMYDDVDLVMVMTPPWRRESRPRDEQGILLLKLAHLVCYRLT